MKITDEDIMNACDSLELGHTISDSAVAMIKNGPMWEQAEIIVRAALRAYEREQQEQQPESGKRQLRNRINKLKEEVQEKEEHIAELHKRLRDTETGTRLAEMTRELVIEKARVRSQQTTIQEKDARISQLVKYSSDLEVCLENESRSLSLARTELKKLEQACSECCQSREPKPQPSKEFPTEPGLYVCRNKGHDYAVLEKRSGCDDLLSRSSVNRWSPYKWKIYGWQVLAKIEEA